MAAHRRRLDRPFGQDHPPDRIRAAKEAGETLARALARRGGLSPGTLARLRSAVKRYSVDVAVRLPPDLEVFLCDIVASGGNWLEAEKALAEAIRSAADTRAGDDPDDVITLLTDLKAELAYLPHTWRNRTWIALGERAGRELSGLDGCRRTGVMRCPWARHGFSSGRRR